MAVANCLGVSVRLERLDHPLLGLTVSEHEVVIHKGLRPAPRRFVVAHEIGHVLVRRGVLPNGHRDEERIADAFARELLVPAASLGPDVNITSFAQSRGVEPVVVVAQLATAGHLPPLVRFCGAVVCARCGDRSHDLRCDCTLYRQRPNLHLPAVA
jgi:Zn-dependent peptidase ImmA (M78 family)